MVNARRARELGRVKAQRQAAARAAQQARRRRLSAIGGVVVAVLAVIGGGVAVAVTGSSAHHKSTLSQAKTSTSPATSATPSVSPAAAKGTPVCDYIASSSGPTLPGARHYGLPPDRKATGHPVATIVTNRGTITVALDAAKAPCTVNSFEFLAAKGYFNHTSCHRLTAYPATSATQKGLHVLQCGDPTGTGQGGPGYTIPDENLAGASYPVGSVAMANTGQPHSGGSQFFFIYGPTTLPPSYTPFGTVTSGLSVLQAIAAKGEVRTSNQPDGAPKEKVIIERFTIRG